MEIKIDDKRVRMEIVNGNVVMMNEWREQIVQGRGN